MRNQEYLLNCWYGLGWKTEVDDGKLLSRRILGMDLVAFRDAEGRPAALLDRCPHRMAPLNRGTVRDGTVECGYHGLRFDGAGRCVGNPFGAVPDRAHVDSFAVVERDQMLWIWPGDAALADPSQIPDYGFQNRDGVDDDWVVFGHTQVDADYQLETDNLLDLSHTEFLHAGSFGGRGFIQKGEFQLRDFGNEIHSNWWMPKIPFIDPATRKPTGEWLDHFLDMRWNAPSNMRLHVSFLPHGAHADRKDTERPVILPNDAGGIRARRRLAKLIREEKGLGSAETGAEEPPLGEAAA